MSDTVETTGQQLMSFIQRFEELDREKQAISDTWKEAMEEAKSVGFEPRIIRKILQIRRRTKADVQEEEILLRTYMEALGMI